jgi:hypothetical protein
LVTSIRPKERVKKGKERIQERGGDVGGLWLDRDREKQMAIEELEGAECKWSPWESPEAEKG